MTRLLYNGTIFQSKRNYAAKNYLNVAFEPNWIGTNCLAFGSVYLLIYSLRRSLVGFVGLFALGSLPAGVNY